MKKLLIVIFVGFAFAKEYSVDSIDSLQNALSDIQNISEDGVINIKNGKYVVNSPLLYVNDKTQKITINGNDSIFEAKNNQIFIFNNKLSTVTFNNIVLKNASSDDSGGAIFSNGSLIINYSIFKNNKGINGGAVSANSITIDSSNFEDNEALYGGAVDALEGVTVSKTTFKANSAKYGGAIIAKLANISYSSFSYNSAEVGGAVSVDDGFHISNSLFKNNSAIYGGALAASSNNTILASRFKNNFATYGGAVIVEDDLTVENSLFLKNISTYGAGVAAKTCNVNNSTFLDNFATKYASAIYAGGKIENSIFLDRVDEIVLSNDLTINNSSVNRDRVFKNSYSLSLSNIYDFTQDDLALIDGFRLSLNSKAISKANSNATNYDIDNNKRDSSADIGASEFVANAKRVGDMDIKLFVDRVDSGWSLVSFDEDVYLNSDIFNALKSVWVYRDKGWLAYSKDLDTLKSINDNHIEEVEKIYSYEGVWIRKP